LSLVGLDINNEDQGVVLLNLLHRALGVERVDDDLVLIEARLRGDGLAEVLRVARKLEGLRLVEGCRVADLADLLRVGLGDVSMWLYWIEKIENLHPSTQTSQQRWLACRPCPWWRHLLTLTHQQSLLMNSQYLLLLVRNFRPHGGFKSFNFSKKFALILRIHGASIAAEHIG
jgi:hypothetical protein